MVSTLTIRGLSRIEREFEASNQRRYFVPCPQCGHMQWLQFERLRWDKGHPQTATYHCVGCDRPIRQGIEFDRIGRRVAYHFLRRHAGDSTNPGLSGEVVRVLASESIHVIDPVEGGQLRGVSKLAPAIVKLLLLDQYDDAELDRKKVAAIYVIFVTSPAPENPLAPDDEDEPEGVEISPGQIVRLDPGEDVTIGQTIRVDLQVAEVSNPRPGDRIEIDGEAFLIQGEPVRDRERLVWTVDLRPA